MTDSTPSPFGQPESTQPTQPLPPQGSPYGAPVYGAPYGSPMGPPAGRRNGFGVAAMILGILAVLGSIVVFPGLVLGVLAIVFGLLGRGRTRRKEADNGGQALTGVICGAVAVVLSAGLLVGVILVLQSDSGKRWRDCTDRAVTQPQQDECTRQFTKDLLG